VARGNTYVMLNRRISNNPLLAVPLLRHPAAVFGTAWHDGTWNQPKAEPIPYLAPVVPAPVALDPGRELRVAGAGMRDAVRVYDFARKRSARRTRRGPSLPPACTPERISARQSATFTLFNKHRAQLIAARRRLDATRLALGLPLAD